MGGEKTDAKQAVAKSTERIREVHQITPGESNERAVADATGRIQEEYRITWEDMEERVECGGKRGTGRRIVLAASASTLCSGGPVDKAHRAPVSLSFASA